MFSNTLFQQLPDVFWAARPFAGAHFGLRSHHLEPKLSSVPIFKLLFDSPPRLGWCENFILWSTISHLGSWRAKTAWNVLLNEVAITTFIIYFRCKITLHEFSLRNTRRISRYQNLPCNSWKTITRTNNPLITSRPSHSLVRFKRALLAL